MNGLPAQWATINQLFSVIMVLDQELNVVRSSDTVRRYLPRAVDCPPLSELFEIRRPTVVGTFEDMRANTHLLYLMVARDDSFAVRGQIVDLCSTDGKTLCFLGSPWLSWMHARGLDTSLSDFAPQDAQMDQLFHLSTVKRMVADLERLNQRLQVTTDELKAAQVVKTAFFAQMSHELRTPLNGVVSALTLLQDQGFKGQAKELLKLGRESSRNLMQVINYVLDVSKLELARPGSEERTFALQETLDLVVSIVRPGALEKGLALDCHVDDGLHRSYRGDASLLRQCLLNLATNAIKFTAEGKVSIFVTPAMDEEEALRFEVSDTGIGIAPQNHDVIFEPFQRVHNEDAAALGAGTGLGLDIVKRNVKHMGGRIGVISALGEGSSFWIEVPLEPVSEDPDPMQHQPTRTSSDFGLRGRVLLVDDNHTNLMLGEMLLQSIGLEVSCATSGKAAIAIVRDESPDLVLMDISMPDMDGFEATRQIRAFRDARSLPIVALTAYASATERKMSSACGMDGYLTKPIVMEELVDTLSVWLPRGDHASTSEGNGLMDESIGSVVDYATLDNLVSQIGHANLTRVLHKFLNEIDVRWTAILGASTNAVLAREAHALASTCRSFGLASVGDKIACIERHAKSDDEEGEPPCIAETGRELRRGASALKAAMKQYQAAG